MTFALQMTDSPVASAHWIPLLQAQMASRRNKVANAAHREGANESFGFLLDLAQQLLRYLCPSVQLERQSKHAKESREKYIH